VQSPPDGDENTTSTPPPIGAPHCKKSHAIMVRAHVPPLLNWVVGQIFAVGANHLLS
jgi:hypothetical protein